MQNIQEDVNNCHTVRVQYESALKKKVNEGSEEDGKRVRWGDCQPVNKYIKNSTRYVTTTKQPLDDSQRAQSSGVTD